MTHLRQGRVCLDSASHFSENVGEDKILAGLTRLPGKSASLNFTGVIQPVLSHFHLRDQV